MKYIIENNQTQFDFSKTTEEKQKLAQIKQEHTKQLINFYTKPVYDMFRHKIKNCNAQLRVELVAQYAKVATKRKKERSAEFVSKLKLTKSPVVHQVTNSMAIADWSTANWSTLQ